MNKPSDFFIQRCLRLAKKGINSVAPNPMVGCVITIPNKECLFGEEIIGEGYHKQFGGAHAEVNAIASVKDKSSLTQATAYVSLEPCSHFGKTPPCADLLIEHKIKKVVVASLDPNPKVAGNGIAKLKAAGIDVDVNVLQTDAEELNKRFNTFFTKKRPYVVLKWAQTKNGYINDLSGEQKQISNLYSKQFVHQIRSNEAAIMIAKNTALTDDPSLTTREWGGSSPLRVLMDSKLAVSNAHSVIRDEPKTLVFNELKQRIEESTEYIKVSPKNIKLVLSTLYKKGINSVLVEGGSQLLQSFINENLWDEAIVFESENCFENGIKAPEITQKKQSEKNISNNKLSVYRNSHQIN